MAPAQYIPLPKFLEHVLVWHLAVGGAALLMVVGLLAVRRRRRLQQEEDANVKSGLALLWALNQKDVSSRLAYFTKRRANEVSLKDSQQQIRTQEFDDMTHKTARVLRSGIVAPGECVLVCLPEGLDYYKIITACLRANIHFVPLSITVAEQTEQVKKIIDETKATAIITNAMFNTRLKQGPIGSLRLITIQDMDRMGEAKDLRLRAPKAQDAACTIFTADTNGPTSVRFSHQNMWAMMDSWLQSGMHSKAVSASFTDSTDITAISFFLSTVCSGGQFMITDAEKPSLQAIQKLGATHSLLADEVQASFNWTTAAPNKVERTLYVGKPTASFADAASKNNMKLRAVLSTPLVNGGVAGVTTKLTVLREELLTKGQAKYLSVSQRLKSGTNVGTVPDTMTFMSQGLLQDNVDLLIRRGESCVEDDVVGEIYIRSSLVAAQCTGMKPEVHAGFTSTGEYGFISSKDLHLYVVAGLSESIVLDSQSISTVPLEREIEKKHPVSKTALFPIQGKDASIKIAIVAELKKEDEAKMVVANLQRFAKDKKLPLGAVVLTQPGEIPASRAGAKMQFLEDTLKALPGGKWAPAERKAIAASAAPQEEEMNLDDVEVITFVAKGVDKREDRKREILDGAINELGKMGIEGLSEKTTEVLLSSQQMAQAAKRFERMLTTTEAEWTKMGVAGDAAPWGEGICIRQSIEVGAMMFLDTEGDLPKILEQLERKKFPTTKEVGAIRTAAPKLPAAKYEGEPMGVGKYRVLELCGSVFVSLVAGLAVFCATKMYAFVQTTALKSIAFSLGFPTFLTSFSLLVCLCKWVLIGRYKPCALARYSMDFYKWWVMDRLVETWEGWAAVFIMETPFLTTFYMICGSDVDWSANVAATYREFDLVSIGADGDVSGTICTHLVTPQGVIMHKVRIGVAAKTDSKAIIGPNVIMEDGSTLDKCEVAQSGTVVKAPAEPRQPDRPAACRLQIYQFILNLFGGMFFIGNFISPTATGLAESLRTSAVWMSLGANANLEGPYFVDAVRWVCYYMIFLWVMGAMLLVWTIAFKWIFFGRLKDGHVTSGVWWDLRVYMLGWWWNLVYMFFTQYWIDCTLLAITVYNAFGAKVSYKTGLRFLQNMSPHHADFITIKDGANMSNAKCHPSTAENRKVLKNIVLEENTFVGLQSIVQGGVTLAKGSAVATTTRCTKSLAPGQTLVGNRIMEATKKADAEGEMDLSSLTAKDLLKDLVTALFLRCFVNLGFILGMAAAITVCFHANDYFPMPIVIVIAVASVSFFVGVVYAWIAERLLHPRMVADLRIGQDSAASTWLQYLQGLYLSQAYTFSVINGSWIAAAFHRLLGADTPLDAQWYSTAIRDQCLLKVGSNSVIDQGAYLVGHVGQPGGVLSFKKASLGDNCTLHPNAIMLCGQHMKDNSSLDMWSHSHIEKVIPENRNYTGNPATHTANSRVNIVASTF